jgi:hypothetical protein
VDSIGGNLDAFTAKELVCFNTKVLDEHLSRAFDVLADLVLHPLFRDEDIEKEKGVILEEIKMEADSPTTWCTRSSPPTSGRTIRWASRFWARARPSKRFDRRHRDYYRRLHARQPAVTAAGNLTHERWWPGAPAFRRAAARDWRRRTGSRNTHARIALRNKKALEQVHVCLGVPSYPAAARASASPAMC